MAVQTVPNVVERLGLPGFFADIHNLAARVQLVSQALDSKEPLPSGSIDLETAVDTLTRTRQTMRRLHNLTRPIMRLPPEIFGMIFMCLRVTYLKAPERVDPFMIDACPRRGYTWVDIMHVCHYWRSVARTCRQLWTTIAVYELRCKNPARLVASHLERSGNLSLAVDLPVTYRVKESVALEVLKNLHRLRTLRLSGKLSPSIQALLVSSDAPLLEAFAMYMDIDDYSGDWGDADESAPLTLPSLFNGIHPKLESLSFCTYRRYGENSFPGLRHLHVSGQAFVAPEDFRALMDLLDRLPMLEAFMISNPRFTEMMEGDVGALNVDGFRVTIPRLQQIIMSEMYLPFAGLMLRSLALAQHGNLAIRYHAKELYIEDPTDEERQDAGVSGLHLLGPEWERMVQNAHTACVHAYAQGWWNIAAISDQRELCLEQLTVTIDDAHNVLPRLVQRVIELWLEFLDRPRKEDPIFNISNISWFLKTATQAKRVFLRVDVARCHGPLPILMQLCKDPNNPLAALEECHASVYRPGDPEVMTHAENFFRLLAASTITTKFHIYLETHYADKTTDVVTIWKNLLRTRGLEGMVNVELHPRDEFPKFPLSTRCKDMSNAGYSWS